MLRVRFVGLVVVLALLLPVTAAFGSDENAFQGPWVGTDVIDGSRNTLIVGGGSNHVIYEETGLTACFNAFGEFVGGSVTGFAEIDGNTLTFTGTLYCNLEEGRAPHPGLSDFEWVVNYDPQTDSVRLALDPTVLARPGN